MTLQAALLISPYSEARFSLNTVVYTVDAERRVTFGVVGTPVTLIPTLPQDVADMRTCERGSLC